MWLDIDISVMSNASSRSARRKMSSGSPGSALMRTPGIAMLPSRIGRERSVGTHASVRSSMSVEAGSWTWTHIGAAHSARSLPPGGEGLGVEVKVVLRMPRRQQLRPPLPSPPPQGGREQAEYAAPLGVNIDGTRRRRLRGMGGNVAPAGFGQSRFQRAADAL